MLGRLRARAAGEQGAILVLTAVMLVFIIGIAALAIDAGSFYQAQRQAQGAADAAALAGADAIASSGTTATAAAAAAASSTATINDPGAAPTVTATANAVTVQVNTSTPALFGRIFNAGNPAVSARAVASVPQAAYSPCTSSGSGCWAVWASDKSCSNPGVTISAGSMVVNGGIHSNGSISVGGGANVFNGLVQYGNGSGCSLSNTAGANIYNGAQQSTAPSDTWPIDYAQQYPACSASGAIKCTGPNGTPSYCNYASSLTSFPVNTSVTGSNSGIYCIYGNGTPSDPSTYTGAVTFGWGGQIVNASYICGSVNEQAGAMILTAYNYGNGNNMLFYAATGNVTFGGGGTIWSGDTFAPSGTINITSGANVTQFLEGKDVVLGAGAEVILGDGPKTSGGGGSSGGIASLSQ